MNTLPTTTTPPQRRRRHTLRTVILSVLGGLTILIVAISIVAGVAGQHGTVRQHAATATSVLPVDTAPATAPAASQAPAGTSSQLNALQSARDYLSMQGFSRKGLIRQLSSKAGDGFPRADAVWAVKHLHANWFVEAVQSAREYLQMQAFSRSGLINQLSSPSGEQFTLAQARYAADKVGL